MMPSVNGDDGAIPTFVVAIGRDFLRHGADLNAKSGTEPDFKGFQAAHSTAEWFA